MTAVNVRCLRITDQGAAHVSERVVPYLFALDTSWCGGVLRRSTMVDEY